ncbi:nuclear pore complex NUP58 [Chlorella sorokiniana]|uniref:Nuclear pore complex NUP58 n=1 Tax=Chlorella sorokiniana TaxID=3076 RepID=A0A2P6TBU4_CHLSO|nr:nuclear pore complex NUP58 [Chlorella sorokiniana]|eukprot:PRW18350.1 nuclear pore complex NUP58 [Chlorella sorokiniana]
MFSFGSAPVGGASTPAFGAASTPSLFGAASSAAAGFGAAVPAFGASPSPFMSTPAFGASSASLFGAASTPSLFGAQPAPSASLFGAASTPSLFGAASTPSLFGAQPASAPSLFGAASAGALTTFGAAPAPSLFGGQPAAGQQVTALATKDGRPITHGSKWDDLSPQTQQYLTELEKVVVQYREDCRQLDSDPRLASSSGAKEQQEAMQGQARSLSQSISALGSAVKADVEQVAALREAVLYLVRSTETALHTFKRSYAWREAAKASAPLASQDVAGPPVLPSTFLREAVAGFLDRLRAHQAAVAELEAVLVASGAAGAQRRGGGHDGLQALQTALTNVHDLLIHTAAKLQVMDDRVGGVREAYLSRQRALGDGSDPFLEEARRQQKRADAQPRSPAAQAAALQAAQQQHGAQPMPAGHAPAMFGASPLAAGAPAASPGGLFGTVAPSPGGAFGTPLFGQQQRTTPSSRKPSSRRR